MLPIKVSTPRYIDISLPLRTNTPPAPPSSASPSTKCGFLNIMPYICSNLSPTHSSNVNNYNNNLGKAGKEKHIEFISEHIALRYNLN